MDEDKKLVEKAVKGDTKAFEMIVQKYQGTLVNYVGRMVGERELALDLTQDVFLKTYSSLHTYQPQYKFRTWLFRIASNTVIDFWRKKKIDAVSIDQASRDDSVPDLQIQDKDPSVVSTLEISELRKKIEMTLQKIPPALRELFVWRHINGFSYQEMAEITGLPLGTIKNRVFQAKELIREQLELEA